MKLDDLNDDEIVEHIVEALEEDGRVSLDYIRIECVEGRVTLSGRVGIDESIQIVEEVLHDVVGLNHFDNQLWVDDTLAFDSTGDSAKEQGDDFEEDLVERDTFDEDPSEEDN